MGSGVWGTKPCLATFLSTPKLAQVTMPRGIVRGEGGHSYAISVRCIGVRQGLGFSYGLGFRV